MIVDFTSINKHPHTYYVGPDHPIFDWLISRTKNGHYWVKLTDGKKYYIGEAVSVDSKGSAKITYLTLTKERTYGGQTM